MKRARVGLKANGLARKAMSRAPSKWLRKLQKRKVREWACEESNESGFRPARVKRARVGLNKKVRK